MASSPSSSSSSSDSSDSSFSVSCDKSFSTNYFLINPEEASLKEIFSLLFSSDVGGKTFVECSAGKKEPFKRRWLIFLSSVVIKFLQVTKKPLADMGSGIENWINLLNGNGGFFNLIINTIKGRVVHPDKESAEYISFTGSMDKRIELDSRVVMKNGGSNGDHLYNASLSVMAAKISYENHNFIQTVVRDHWKMNFIGFYDFWNDYQEKTTTQAFLMSDDTTNTIVVSFRGTETFDADAWSSDFDLSWYELGRVHGGFMKALGLQKSQGWPMHQDPGKTETAYYAIRDLLKKHLQKNDRARFIVTGHSLGGALAALFPAILVLHKEEWLMQRLAGVYTFGQPRVGNEEFGECMKAAMRKYEFDHYRFVYSFDIVPRLPYDDSTLMFKHYGTCVFYNSMYHGKIVTEEPDKNYFSILWLVPKFLNACWELIRSFIIPYTWGPEYTETGTIRLLRMIGLLTAGVPAHMPPDYVNSTRLGLPNVFTSKDSNKALKSE